MNTSVPVRRTAPRARQTRNPSSSTGAGSSAASAAPILTPAHLPTPAPAELPSISLEKIMSSLARRLKPRLHPDRPEKPKDVFLDDCVRTDISSIYQNDFKSPWSCLKNVPAEHQLQWWSRFAQRYYWENEHHDAVVKLYRKQLKDLLKNLISKEKRDGVKPAFVSDGDWNLLLERWDTAPAIKKSKDCSAARKSQRSGYGEHGQTAGSKPFTKIEYEMAKENNGVLPSIIDLIKRTHTKSDGTYVDKKAEKIVEDVYRLATKRSAPNQDSDDGKTTISSLEAHVASLDGKFDTLQAFVNVLIQTLTRYSPPTPTAQPVVPPATQPSIPPQPIPSQSHPPEISQVHRRDLDLSIDDFDLSNDDL